MLLVLVGCSEPLPATALPATAPPEPVPSEAEAFALPASELLARAERAASTADAAGMGPDAISARIAAAAALRVHALRTGHAPSLARARALLDMAAADRSEPRLACEATLALSRLLARDVVDLSAARDTATRGLEDLPRGPTLAACRGELGRIAATLGATVPDESPEADGELPTSAARLERLVVYAGDGTPSASARVVLQFDHRPAAELGPVTAVGGASRASLVLHAVAAGPEVPERREVGAGGLLRVRREGVGGGQRVDFELAPGASVRSFELVDPPRWVLDFEPSAQPRAIDAPSFGPVRTVLLDPGHGGDEHGARVDGVRESHLTLDLAKRVAFVLTQRLPDVRVLLTRSEDVDITLEQRSMMANAFEADVFVSIHLNDADEPVTRGGVTTFVLDTRDEGQALRLAARENGTSPAAVSGMQRILAGLHREEQVAESRRLAERVHQGALAGGRRVLPALPDRGVKSDVFYVLVGARMPAILVEASFMTRPEELAALRTQRYRQSIAEGIAEGIVRYAATR